ncbi:putative dna replication [Diplodia seriata]|uniref:Putative dna replication n=1 Tax=Diplodia seriata TaxID=420778 RepID=A0A0G2ENZ9_9PEZI|nr:putative dna replication [Diplodia seriata]
MIKTDDAMSHAPSQKDTNWPPKSPHQALLSSPSGRKRWEQRHRNQPSPSMGSPRTGSRASQLLSDGIEGADDDEDDDDEETLQLKLQAIEARIRLKKLQAAKAKQADTEVEDGKRRDIFNPDDDDGPNKSKFMVLHLTDFKWEIDLFLFGTAFTSFWKLTPGTLIAILNPGIFPPRDKRTGQFSLKIGSSEDTILEIGNARDLGFCKSVKKDGKECGSWIDKRKTDYLHEMMYVMPKHMNGRSAAARLDHDEDAMSRGMSREELHRKRLAEKERERELADKLSRIGGKAGSEYMRAKATGSRPGTFSSSSSTTAADGSSKHGSSRQPAAAAGAYDTPFNRTHDGPEPVDAASLGLLGKRAADVSLNPVKRKRTTTLAAGSQTTTVPSSSSSSYSTTARHTAEPMGWGGANKRELLLSPSKKKLVGNSNSSTRRIDDMLLRRDNRDRDQQRQQQQQQQSPRGVLHLPERSRSREGSPKKKARLMIEGKGIREPGRESMGSVAVAVAVATKAVSSSDDDDDLEII